MSTDNGSGSGQGQQPQTVMCPRCKSRNTEKKSQEIGTKNSRGPKRKVGIVGCNSCSFSWPSGESS